MPNNKGSASLRENCKQAVVSKVEIFLLNTINIYVDSKDIQCCHNNTSRLPKGSQTSFFRISNSNNCQWGNFSLRNSVRKESRFDIWSLNALWQHLRPSHVTQKKTSFCSVNYLEKVVSIRLTHYDLWLTDLNYLLLWIWNFLLFY